MSPVSDDQRAVRARELRVLHDATPDAVFHRAALALDAGDMGSFEWNAATDALEGDENFRELWDVAEGARMTGEMMFARVHPDDLDALQAELARSMEAGEDYKAEFRIILKEGAGGSGETDGESTGGANVHGANVQGADGSVRWLGARGRVTGRDADARPTVLTGLNWDITETKAQEEKLERLAREMNHRVNNSFAVIESLLTLGSRTAKDTRSFAQMMKAQIHALADAHRLAADHALHDHERSSDVDVVTLAETALRAWTQAPGKVRIELDVDPSIRLPARHVSGMAMLLYELATNATKYGALGEAGGTLALSIRSGGEGIARFEWREVLDGARATTPERMADADGMTPLPSSSGFGTVLVQHCLSLLGGTMNERTVTDDGFHVVISFPHR